MLKITSDSRSPAHCRLKLEGDLIERWLEEFISECHTALKVSSNVELDLKDVRYMDIAGAFALREMRRSGVTIAVSSPFIDALLRTMDGE
jgi:hypothetical protein